MSAPMRRGSPVADAHPPLLEIDGLVAGYGQLRAIDGIDLAVGTGEIVALLGSNGAGKSTTLRAISGLLRPWQGSIRLDGEPIDQRSPDGIARLGVSHVPEGRGLFPELTVRENLDLGCRLLDPGAADEALERAHELFPVLDERSTQLAGTLSGGQQQMLAIARALAASPRLLMLDELSQGLAPLIVHDLYDRIAGIRDQGTSILLVEQFAASALGVADRVHVMEKGRLTFSGTPAELRSDRDAVRSAYLGTADPVRFRQTDNNVPLEEVIIKIAPAMVREILALADDRGTSSGDEIRAALATHLGTSRRAQLSTKDTPRRHRSTRPGAE